MEAETYPAGAKINSFFKNILITIILGYGGLNWGHELQVSSSVSCI